MEYILEFYLKEEGDVVDSRKAEQPFLTIMSGDSLYLEFDNDNYNTEYGNWFKAIDRRVYIFTPSINIQTTRIYIEVNSGKMDM